MANKNTANLFSLFPRRMLLSACALIHPFLRNRTHYVKKAAHTEAFIGAEFKPLLEDEKAL